MIEMTSETAMSTAVVSVLTPRGAAACRLSDFQDAWSDLPTEDRRWFAAWLRDLLIDAVEEGVPA